MARIAILTAGSHGDVHPYLGVGRALAQRGHDVTVAVNAAFERAVAESGLRFAAMGEPVDLVALIKDSGVLHPLLGSMRVIAMLMDAAPQVLKDFAALLDRERPDAVLLHHICLFARELCEQRGIPSASGALSPAAWFSRLDPVPASLRSTGRAARVVARAIGPLVVPALLRTADRPLNRLRRTLGLPPKRAVLRDEWLGGNRQLGLWSPHFRAPMADDPPASTICGFPFYDGPPDAPLDAGVEAFLSAGPPPLVFCLGTTSVHAPGTFYADAIEASRRLRRRALLLAADAAPDINGRGLQGVHAASYAPLSKVLPRAEAAIVHGGIGSTSQALRAGKPVLVIAVANDQFNNGVRACDLGAGLMLTRSRVTASRLTDRLERLLGSESIARRAGELGATLRAEDGAGAAAREIEQLVR